MGRTTGSPRYDVNSNYGNYLQMLQNVKEMVYVKTVEKGKCKKMK